GNDAAVGIKTGLARRVENIAQAFYRDARLLEVLPQLDDFKNGAAHARGKHIEGHQLADGEVAFHHSVGAEPQNKHGGNFADKAGGLVGDIADMLRLERGVNVVG